MTDPTEIDSDDEAYFGEDDGDGTSDYKHDLDSVMGSLCPWAAILVLFTWYNLASSYMVLVWVLPVAATNVLLRIWKPSYKTTIVLHILSCVPGTTLWLQYSYLLIQFFGPLMGRIGTGILPDMVMGIAVAILALFVLLTPLSLSSVFTPTRRVFRYLFIVVLAAMGLAVILHPYTPNHPKRLFLQHTERRTFTHSNRVKTFSGEIEDCLEAAAESKCTLVDTGMWTIGMDYHSLLRLPLPIKPIPCEGIYCNVPWYFPIKHMIQDSSYVQTSRPPLPDGRGVRLSLVSREDDVDRAVTRFTFRATGPDHMMLIINGTDHGQGASSSSSAVRAWSFSDTVPETRSDCNCHFIFHSYGGHVPDAYAWEFWIDVAREHDLDLAFYGQYLDATSPQIIKHENALPKWVSCIGWLSAWSSHHFDAANKV